jgi:phage-related protein
VQDKPKLGCSFYRSTSGDEPVRSWLRRLKESDRDAARIVGADLARVQWRWPISRPLVGFLGDGLYEARSTVSKVEYRVIFAVIDRELILLHGFSKRTMKTPKADRDLALKRKREVER